MSTLTPNIGLKIPALTDQANIKFFDENWEKIDSEFLEVSQKFTEGEKVYIGPVSYNDSINAGAEITKTIPIGSIKKYGSLVICNTAAGSLLGIRVDITNDKTKALITGFSYKSYDAVEFVGSAWTYSRITGITTENLGCFVAASGSKKVIITECYLNEENLTIKFKNNDTISRSLSCTVEGIIG